MQPRRGRLRAGLRVTAVHLAVWLREPPAGALSGGETGPLNHIFGPRKMRMGTSPGVTVGINMIVDVQCLA